MAESIPSSVRPLLNGLTGRLLNLLGERLLGLYLYGSLVTGDFDVELSDVDMLAVLPSDVNEKELQRLKKLHDRFVGGYPSWHDRVEVAYLSKQALKEFKRHPYSLAVISPGEPLNLKEDNEQDYLMNWWLVREKGITLVGPPPSTFIDEVSLDDFLRCVVRHARYWRTQVYEMKHKQSQAYAILTLCRALYSFETRDQVSKLKAARWAQRHYPRWATLIHSAIEWRRADDDSAEDAMETHASTIEFVEFAANEIDPYYGAIS
jgi:predicted nucleotidyltransferase